MVVFSSSSSSKHEFIRDVPELVFLVNITADAQGNRQTNKLGKGFPRSLFHVARDEGKHSSSVVLFIISLVFPPHSLLTGSVVQIYLPMQEMQET